MTHIFKIIYGLVMKAEKNRKQFSDVSTWNYSLCTHRISELTTHTEFHIHRSIINNESI